jgi:energy-converting hydrogenase Eha subunit A
MYFAIPFIAYGITLFWAAVLGDTIIYWHDNNMLEEFTISSILTIIVIVFYKSKSRDKE